MRPLRLWGKDAERIKPQDMIKLQDAITALSRQLTVLSAQSRLCAVPGAPAVDAKLAGDAKAKILKVPGNGHCAYNVMFAGSGASFGQKVKSCVP